MSQQRTLICSYCNKTFASKSALLSHTKWVHEEKPEYKCSQCGMDFVTSYTLKRHIQNIHERATQVVANIKCSLCSFEAHYKVQVAAHYQSAHAIDLTAKTLTFNTTEEFAVWKRKVEVQTKSLFVKHNTWMVKDGSELTSYDCHRDGHFVPRGANLRNAKLQGTNKINAYCPAKITMQKCGDCVKVTYVDKHVGHEFDLGRMNISHSEKAVVAEKLKLKIPFQEIISDIRQSAKGEELSRFHFVTRKDLWNIADSFNIKHEVSLYRRKQYALEAFLKIYSKIQNEKQLQAAVDCIVPLDSMVTALATEDGDFSEINSTEPGA